MEKEIHTIRVIVTPEDELLVKRTARRVYTQYRGRSDIQLEEELYHFGLVGLLEAKKKFIKAKGIPFHPFAIHRIKGAMIDHLRLTPVIRLPQKKQELKKLLEQARQDLVLKNKEGTDIALARQLEWSVEKVHRVKALQTNLVSLSDTAVPGQDTHERAPERDLLSKNPGPEENVLKNELGTIVQTCLDKMSSARDRLILVARVLHGKKLRELAENMACSIENIRLRQKKAMLSMKRCLEDNGWDQQSMTDFMRQ